MNMNRISHTELQCLCYVLSAANYVSSYSVPYNSMHPVTPTPSEYTSQPPVHVVPTYYPGQSGIQPPSVMYRVPTPPNTPTSHQVLKYVVINKLVMY